MGWPVFDGKYVNYYISDLRRKVGIPRNHRQSWVGEVVKLMIDNIASFCKIWETVNMCYMCYKRPEST
jgi:hypothetical protein